MIIQHTQVNFLHFCYVFNQYQNRLLLSYMCPTICRMVASYNLIINLIAIVLKGLFTIMKKKQKYNIDITKNFRTLLNLIVYDISSKIYSFYPVCLVLTIKLDDKLLVQYKQSQHDNIFNFITYKFYMGCGSSNQQEVENPNQITDLSQWRISQHGMVGEKIGQISQDYHLLKPPLGKGAFGEVRKAVHKLTNQSRAIKIISKEKAGNHEIQKLKEEVEILRNLDHPNIIKIFEFYQDSRNFYIVTELCTGGELFDKIVEQNNFSERKAAETMKQILSAVNYCHQSKIVHRDLKPENILYESSKAGAQLKIVDFGTSKVFDPNQKMNQKLGTPYYIAPEVLERKYDEKCDIWSCGVILYILLSGSPPFSGDDDLQIMEAVKRGQYSFDSPEWKEISIEAKNLIRKMLDRDPRKRISAEDALNDDWINLYVKKPEMDLPQLVSVLNNMRSFRMEKKFQEAAITFMVNYLATSQEKSELIQQFQALDLNNDGKLSREELIIGYSKVLSYSEAEIEVDKLMQSIDQDRNGSIDYSEFVLATFNKLKLVEDKRLEQAFKMFDKDGSGTISIDELKIIFGNSKNISDRVWKDLVKEVDQNEDGQISFKEFKEIIIKAIQVNEKDLSPIKLHN
ncbi:Protein kinase domain containing protein [Paramecium bursaria]